MTSSRGWKRFWFFTIQTKHTNPNQSNKHKSKSNLNSNWNWIQIQIKSKSFLHLNLELNRKRKPKAESIESPASNEKNSNQLLALTHRIQLSMTARQSSNPIQSICSIHSTHNQSCCSVWTDWLWRVSFYSDLILDPFLIYSCLVSKLEIESPIGKELHHFVMALVGLAGWRDSGWQCEARGWR